jgi:hypothetical protein
MTRNHLVTLALGALIGYMLAGQIARIPLVNKLPQF